MNLRAMANSVTCTVNANIQATLCINQGYTVTDDGTQIPSYERIPKIVDVQGLNTSDLAHLGDVAQQGQYNAVYLDGLLDAQIRSLDKGEDTIEFVPQGETEPVKWRVVRVLERYTDLWTKVAICRQ